MTNTTIKAQGAPISNYRDTDRDKKAKSAWRKREQYQNGKLHICLPYALSNHLKTNTSEVIHDLSKWKQ